MAYPAPQGGASLMLAFRLKSNITLIIGSGPLAASRAFSALEADSKVVILAKGTLEAACEEIQWRSAQNQLTFIPWDTLPCSSKIAGQDRDVEALDSYLTTTPGIRLVCFTDTLSGGSQNRPSRIMAEEVYRICNARNIPVNTADTPDLCDFTFASTHRFEDPDNEGIRTPLQVGVTTNGQGCRLAGRIKRDVVSRLPKHVGVAVSRVGRMRALAKANADAVRKANSGPVVDGDKIEEDEDELEENGRVTTPNRPVPSRSPTETDVEISKRKMRWVAQVSEYWPISKLAQMSDEEMESVLAGDYNSTSTQEGSYPNTIGTTATFFPPSRHSLDLSPPLPSPHRPGKILLVGSGPGHPSLLTLATHTALTKMADLVLSDKLVPDAVLALIPKTVEVRIAKKFPGNADGAQVEIMEAAVEAAKRGLTVVRLKQGDLAVYARTGEEVLFFRSHNFEPILIPGVSSALAAPAFAGIQITQRGVAESFIVCTGVGRKGREIVFPGYERGRTVVVLMGVARLERIVRVLVGSEDGREEQGEGKELPAAGRTEIETEEGKQPMTRTKKTKGRSGKGYPPHTPIAIIERASTPDQRVITSTLRDIVAAMENVGEQRPPGMMVIGWTVLALWGEGDVRVLEDSGEEGGGEDGGTGCMRGVDEQRVGRWLGGGRWRVQEGLGRGWEELESLGLSGIS